MDTIIQILARELGRSEAHVENVVRLIDEGNTIPFIARYRKELHGAMDDTALRTLADRLQYLRNLDKRREEVKSAIEGQGKLTEELSAAIDAAATLAEVEDLYRPYKQKRRTRATVAREKGLEPLAELLFAQAADGPAPEEAAGAFIDPEKGVATAEDALQGASDIIAERISDDADIRKRLRELVWKKGSLVSAAAAKEPEDTVYRLYYAFRSPLNRVQGHQVLAINRGEREGVLKVSVEMEREAALIPVRRAVLNPGAPAMAFVRAAAEDAYDRLIFPSVEREMRGLLTEQADEGAIKMFGLNLKPLLMQPPVKGFVTMGLDPGYRNGCKVAVVDATGKVLDTAVVYPTFSQRKKEEAIDTLAKLIRRHGVAHIAIGNGTASRETEQMTVELIRRLGGGVSYMIVNEAGASVYSASKLAAEEFPDYDVNLRSAVSIARRLQDPLAELVKIDPKSIGVGQYQHDVSQTQLARKLDAVVEDCVNAVGVDLNTASVPLLTRVAGLTRMMAQNIVAWRDENGQFQNRQQLLKVSRLGPKAFEQCAGFLRINHGDNPLDASTVHPEAYPVVERILAATQQALKDLMGNSSALRHLKAVDFTDEKFGVPTVTDIIKELEKPGRDPRPEFKTAKFADGVETMNDLLPGMILEGAVTNVTNFGAFVDIGVHQDGLVHISSLSDRFVEDPHTVVKAGDIVKVKVMEVDLPRKRIALTMRLDEQPGDSNARRGGGQERPLGNRPAAKAAKTRGREAQPAGNSAMMDALAAAMGKKR